MIRKHHDDENDNPNTPTTPSRKSSNNYFSFTLTSSPSKMRSAKSSSNSNSNSNSSTNNTHNKSNHYNNNNASNRSLTANTTATSISASTSISTANNNPNSNVNPSLSTSSSSSSSSPSSSPSPSSVQVAVRVRPVLPAENGSHKCITVKHSSQSPSMGAAVSNMIEIGAGGSKMGDGNAKKFLFDACFSPRASQREVFEYSVMPLIDACLDGYNATVLAYGQTGSGKTHTILGPSAESGFDNSDSNSRDSASSPTNHLNYNHTDNLSTSSSTHNHSSQAGVIPRALRDLFHKLEFIKGKKQKEKEQQQQQQHDIKPAPSSSSSSSSSTAPYEYEVRVQFLELYGEEIRDLLSRSNHDRKLVIRDGVKHSDEPDVVGAMEVKVNNAAEALLCLTRGSLRRVTGATAMNAESSRSHAIMTVIVEQTTVVDNGGGGSGSSGAAAGGGNNEEDFESKRSKFHFVDLAGSERQKRSRAEGLRLKEGIDINKGLLVLGNVISALGDPKKKGKAFVPYRDSKLTRLLKGSLGGNHKTLMIACVSPSSLNMEESLNCLRYANRAKNIQNNAVMNVDAGSKLVTELRGQVQALASELLAVQTDQSGDNNNGKEGGSRFTNEMLKKLASGSDSSNMKFGSASARQNGPSTPPGGRAEDIKRERGDNTTSIKLKGREGRQLNAEKAFLEVSKAEISILKQTIKDLKNELACKAEELFAAKAEAEYYRMQLNPSNEVNMNGSTSNDKRIANGEEETAESKAVFLNQVTEYEREIAKLKMELREAKVQVLSSSTSDADDDTETTSSERALTPESSVHSSPPNTLKKKRRARRAAEALERESKDEQMEIDRIAKKYIGLSSIGVDDDDEDNTLQSASDTEADGEESFMNRQADLDAHMMEISKGIIAKEELIGQLRRSQTKYETMNNFYQDKLRRMTVQLREQESERVALEVELKKYEHDSQKHRDLRAALKAKEKHIDHLRNRQAEIESLTSIASRNESVIENLKREILQMKQQKIALTKQLTKERKDHEKSSKILKKKASYHEKDANKARQDLAKTQLQKKRVQDIAKSHAEEVSQLRTKYQESEKKLRMQTLKRGVMERAGIDPVLVGRKVKNQKSSRTRIQSPPSFQDKRAYTSSDIHQMRSFLDDKVAEISRKEVTADKLAIEWEDHLGLTTRKQQIVNAAKGKKDSPLSDELEALDFQIQYKESRIRQLASRLSARPKSSSDRDANHFLQDTMIDDRKFKEITSEFSALAGAQMASKVLFGMVVKERRRVAKLARTASSLDQKVLDAEKVASSKEAALRSHMEESKNERVAMAQSHQERILSLMSLLHQDQDQYQVDGKISPERHDSVILSLANERIDTLEKQLEEMQMEKETREKYQERESETVQELTKLTDDYGQMLAQSKYLHQSLAKVREKITAHKSDIGLPDSKDKSDILKIIDAATNRGASSSRTKSKTNINSPKSINRRINKPVRSPFYETESEEEDEPEWAGHIMNDLAIIAAGDVPPSLRKTTNHRPPIRGTANIYDRLSHLDSYTGSQKNITNDRRNDDTSSVGSTYSSRNSTVRKDRASLMRVQPSGQTSKKNSNNRSPVAVRSHSRSRTNTPSRKRVYNPTPFQHTTPSTPGGSASVRSSTSRSRLTDRIAEILKDSSGGSTGPPTELSIPSRIPNRDDTSSVGNEDKRFIKAYTKKDVFERLQKKMTNSYALAQKAVIEDDERNYYP